MGETQQGDDNSTVLNTVYNTYTYTCIYMSGWSPAISKKSLVSVITPQTQWFCPLLNRFQLAYKKV